MARPRSTGLYLDHPHPRFKDRIRLVQKLSGAHDLTWRAQYLVAGVWNPKKPASLSTTVFEDAIEVARDRFVILESGGEIATKGADNSFEKYARLAIIDLRAQGETAKLVDRGKQQNFTDLVGRIERILIPAFGKLDIRKFDDDAVVDWVAGYRVIDQEATLARYGKQKAASRQLVMKRPAATTLGNVDRAMRCVWLQAVADKKVRRRDRPIIDKDIKEEFGQDGEARAFIDTDGCIAVYRLISTDRWLHGDNGHTTDYKRMLRVYIALIATAGIRPGIELKRTMIGDITATEKEGVQLLQLLVRKNAGKHKRQRNTTVYEGSIFPTRRWLTDLLAWQEKRGAVMTTKLFAWDADGVERCPQFRDGVKDVLTAAGVLRDPMTNDERVAYSFRHWFATMLIDKGVPTAHIAVWMGTSEYMIERHYNRWLLDSQAHLRNGARPINLLQAELMRAYPDFDKAHDQPHQTDLDPG
jgi:integrase